MGGLPQAGDEVLKQLGKILRKSFRLTDLVARYGGEEFVVLLDDVLMEGAEKVAKNLCQKIAVTGFTISSAQEKLKQTVSIGVSEYNKENL